MRANLKARGIKGAQNASNLDRQIWREFTNNWESLPFESETLLLKLKNEKIDLAKEEIQKKKA
jgi:putative restriction endonuclease